MQHDWLDIFLLVNKSGAVLGEAWGPDYSVLTLAFLETLMSFPCLLNGIWLGTHWREKCNHIAESLGCKTQGMSLVQQAAGDCYQLIRKESVSVLSCSFSWSFLWEASLRPVASRENRKPLCTESISSVTNSGSRLHGWAVNQNRGDGLRKEGLGSGQRPCEDTHIEWNWGLEMWTESFVVNGVNFRIKSIRYWRIELWHLLCSWVWGFFGEVENMSGPCVKGHSHECYSLPIGRPGMERREFNSACGGGWRVGVAEQASRFLVGRGPLGSHFYLCPSFCLFSLKHSFLYFFWSKFEHVTLFFYFREISKIKIKKKKTH